MKSFDALVSTHRSEGFGMNPWHAMALGVPVICTDYGGTTDFAGDDTAWLVEAGTSRPSGGEVAIFPHLDGITWAEPSVESAMEQMRACVSDHEERTRRAAAGVELVREKYCYARTGVSLMVALEMAVPGSHQALRRQEDEIEVPPRHDGTSPARMIEI
jgi:hypothetical protein